MDIKQRMSIFHFMLKSFYKKNQIEAGCDEAGRGCLAGPVFAAAVLLPPKYKNKLLNDSKQVNEANRNILRAQIEADAIDFAVAQISPAIIDEINILNASILGMHEALNRLKASFEFILIDGNRFKPYKDIPHQCIVKGDSKFMSIAAASILAKTYRDEHMLALHQVYPNYGWDKNMGYPTKGHREAIKLHGPCKEYRMSFKLLPEGEDWAK